MDSTGPSLDIHVESFRLSKASLLIGCAEQPSPIPGASLSTSIPPSLAILGKSFDPQKALLFIGRADRPSPP